MSLAKTLFWIFIFSIFLSPNYSRAEDALSELRTIGITEISVAEHPNRKLETKVTVEGYLPNSCYQLYSVRVASPEPNLHEISTIAQVSSGRRCAYIMIRFSEEISLGKLSPGMHTIRFLQNDGSIQEIKFSVD